MPELTKTDFIKEYRAHLLDTYGKDWAADRAKLARFMESVSATLTTAKATWNWDAELSRAAWRSCGGKGKMTLKALRALPDGEG